MAWAQPEADDDDDTRVYKTVVEALAIAVEHLTKVTAPMKVSDAQFIGRMDVVVCVLRQMPVPDEVKRIKQLSWDFRRHIPRGFAPVLPPNDPVVVEMGVRS